jgi:hypothetical protein
VICSPTTPLIQLPLIHFKVENQQPFHDKQENLYDIPAASNLSNRTIGLSFLGFTSYILIRSSCTQKMNCRAFQGLSNGIKLNGIHSQIRHLMSSNYRPNAGHVNPCGLGLPPKVKFRPANCIWPDQPMFYLATNCNYHDQVSTATGDRER